jgi:hypothetical protein
MSAWHRLMVASCIWAAGIGGAFAAATDVPIVPDDIGGVVTGPKGPEAGVWVIAETTSLPTKFVKIVVTDDKGRYVLPELPMADYKVWVRGYGLVDSKPVQSKPGQRLDLAATVAPDAKAAAEIYPANYWYAMLHPPKAEEFPGTGHDGNGISIKMKTQQDWLAVMKEDCTPCHQIGDKSTRELANNSVEGWAQRLLLARENGDPTLGNRGKEFSANMQNAMAKFGRDRGLNMFADWSKRIAEGELPAQAPPRPQGVERNLVISEWDWANGHFVHDVAVSDKRNPNVDAGGLVYGEDNISHNMVFLDPKTAKISESHVPDDAKGVPFAVHTPTEDAKGRVWIAITEFGEGEDPAFCGDGSLSKFAAYWPNPRKLGRHVALYDPKTKETTMIPVCWGNLHLKFTGDKDDALYFSGDANVMGWIKTRVWDETHDAAKSQGWCPMVLDTNGDGKVTPDSKQWNQPVNPLVVTGETGQQSKEDAKAPKPVDMSSDPAKDTRISGFLYGMSVQPNSDISWYAKFTPYVPSGLVRLDPGKNPPETCKTEYYEPPKLPDGTYSAYNARAVDVDSKGVAWVDFGSGDLGKFDRSKCKVLNGPTATGQHCPEGWTIYRSPGPSIAGTKSGADWHYLMYVDQFDVLGLGKDVPITPGTMSDSLLAMGLDGKWTVMRVPYPMGFYSRGMDERIDDPKTGWKGKGLWTDYAEVPIWHIEGGEGTLGKAVKFQIRPDPLAH